MGHEMSLVDCNQDFFLKKRNTVFLDVSSELEGANMKIFYLYLPVLAETTITKYHTLDCLNSRNVFFHCSGDQSLRQISW